MRLSLPLQPPLDADALLHHFRGRAVPGIEEVGEPSIDAVCGSPAAPRWPSW